MMANAGLWALQMFQGKLKTLPPYLSGLDEDENQVLMANAEPGRRFRGQDCVQMKVHYGPQAKRVRHDRPNDRAALMPSRQLPLQQMLKNIGVEPV